MSMYYPNEYHVSILEKFGLHGLKVTCSLRHVILFLMVKVLLHVGGSAADV